MLSRSEREDRVREIRRTLLDGMNRLHSRASIAAAAVPREWVEANQQIKLLIKLETPDGPQPDGEKKVNPVHTDESLQHVDVRIYFDASEPRDECVDNVAEALSDSAALSAMVSAYELVSDDGFSNLTPDGAPLA